MATDYDTLVTVAGPLLTTLRNELTAAAATVGSTVLSDDFTKLANAALPVDNRFLARVRAVEQWARGKNSTLFAACQAVLG